MCVLYALVECQVSCDKCLNKIRTENQATNRKTVIGARWVNFGFLIFTQYLVFVVYDQNVFPISVSFGCCLWIWKYQCFAAAFMPLNKYSTAHSAVLSCFIRSFCFYFWCSICLVWMCVCVRLFFFASLLSCSFLLFFCVFNFLFCRPFCFRRNPFAPRVSALFRTHRIFSNWIWHSALRFDMN